MATHIDPATIAALLDDRAAAGLCDDRPNLFEQLPQSKLALRKRAVAIFCIAIALLNIAYFGGQVVRGWL